MQDTGSNPVRSTMQKRRLMNDLKDVTIFIKTFQRPDCCSRLMNSIRKLYPNIDVIVVNDGGDDKTWEDDHCQTIITDHDIGVSAGRNIALKAIETKYTVQCDDDFVFTDKTDLALWKKTFLKHDFDILGAKIGPPELEPRIFVRVNGSWKFKTGYRKKQDNLYFCDCVGQFLFFEVEKILELGGWDERLLMCEHAPFMLKAFHNNLKVGVTHDVSAYHARDSKFQTEYDAERLPLARRERKKWHLSEYNFSGWQGNREGIDDTPQQP